MNRTPQSLLTGVDGPTGTPNNGNLISGECSSESNASWINPLEVFLTLAMLQFLSKRIGFSPSSAPAPAPGLPSFTTPISGRNVLDAPRRRSGGARL